MKRGRRARRVLRRGARLWWRQARPPRGAGLAGRGEARPAHETGRAPTPDERWVPTHSDASGPWQDVDPHRLGGRRGRGALVAVLGWLGIVALRVRRDVRRTWPPAASDDDTVR